MKLKITGTSLGPGKDGTYAHIGSRGGTEMMAERISNSLSADLASQFNIIHSRVRPDSLSKDRKNILVLHDTWDDPESEHLESAASRGRFAKLVFVSNYQQSTYNIGLGVPYSDGVVLQNAIPPIEESLIDKSGDTIRLIYATTPHRGLELLVPVFERISESVDNIHLDVFSSFSIYGWAERDKPYQDLFERIRQHPKMTYHGYQPNEVVRAAMAKSHIYAYPSIWPETSCIAVMEAMSAKCQIVTSNLAALPETCANFACMYGFTENHTVHANLFANALYRAILEYDSARLADRLNFQKIYTDNFYGWNLRKAQWEAFLGSL